MPHFALRALAVMFGCALAFVAAALDAGLQAIPPLQSRVTDLTATLDAGQRQAIEAQLAALEQRKGAQLAVLIVPTTQPEDIAQYAIRVYDAWKLGRAGIDDGALLLVAKDDRAVRIEVARGLEGAIPDAAAARIIREYLTPKFRAGDFAGGIQDALAALTSLVDGEPLPEPWQGSREREGSDDLSSEILFALFAAFWARAMFARAHAVPRAGLVGAVSGGVAWLASGLVPLGIGLGAVGVILGFLGGGGGGFANRGGWGDWGGGGFGGGGLGGGGWGGGSGGGFSGGGGMSAGGGASGRW